MSLPKAEEGGDELPTPVNKEVVCVTVHWFPKDDVSHRAGFKSCKMANRWSSYQKYCSQFPLDIVTL